MNGRREAFGGMELIGRLSSGGMGEVLLARRRGAHGFEKLVAVKTIRCDLIQRDDIRRMFLDEARLMARLDHPAITQVYDFGEENDVLFLAMEYVPGVVLNRLLRKRGGPLPESVAARIAIQVAHGLHAAHELVDSDGKSLGVVHRDVSPHNLILTFDGRVKILDFGIALFRDREAPETEFGVVKGKVSYIAPEQLKGLRADRRSDIYSLGVVLHELLTGKKLFVSSTPLQDLQERENVPPPSVAVPEVSRAMDDIVMKALAFDPDKRFQDARDVALALERALPAISGETVEEFADRELKEERSSQRLRLSSISSGQERVIGLEAGVPSLAISISSGDVIELDKVSAPHAEGPPELPQDSVVPPVRTSGGPFVFVLLFAAVAAVGVALLVRDPEPSSESDVEDGAAFLARSPRFTAERTETLVKGASGSESEPRTEAKAPSAPASGPSPETGEVAKDDPSAEPGAKAVAAREAEAPRAEEAVKTPTRAGSHEEAPAPEVPAPKPEGAETKVEEPAPGGPAPKLEEAEAKAEEAAPGGPAPKPAEVVASARDLAPNGPRPAPKASEPVNTIHNRPRSEETSLIPRLDPKPKPKEYFPDTPPIPPLGAAATTGTRPAPTKTPAPKPSVAPAPKPADPKKKPQAKSPGLLTVEATPNAVVLIDGKVVGFTPLRDLKVEPGKHEVQIRKPYSRALRMKRIVWLRDSQKLQVVAPPE